MGKLSVGHSRWRKDLSCTIFSWCWCYCVHADSIAAVGHGRPGTIPQSHSIVHSWLLGGCNSLRHHKYDAFYAFVLDAECGWILMLFAVSVLTWTYLAPQFCFAPDSQTMHCLLMPLSVWCHTLTIGRAICSPTVCFGCHCCCWLLWRGRPIAQLPWAEPSVGPVLNP